MRRGLEEIGKEMMMMIVDQVGVAVGSVDREEEDDATLFRWGDAEGK